MGCFLAEICELHQLEGGLQMRILSWADNDKRADVCSAGQYIFVNDSVEFACPCGFQLAGSSVRTCSGAGNLSGRQPHCRGESLFNPKTLTHTHTHTHTHKHTHTHHCMVTISDNHWISLSYSNWKL